MGATCLHWDYLQTFFFLKEKQPFTNFRLHAKNIESMFAFYRNHHYRKWKKNRLPNHLHGHYSQEPQQCMEQQSPFVNCRDAFCVNCYHVTRKVMFSQASVHRGGGGWGLVISNASWDRSHGRLPTPPPTYGFQAGNMHPTGMLFTGHNEVVCQGNVFTGVCHSVNGRVSASEHVGIPSRQEADTPPEVDPPGGRHPTRSRHPPDQTPSKKQTPPWFKEADRPLGADTPWIRHPPRSKGFPMIMRPPNMAYLLPCKRW